MKIAILISGRATRYDACLLPLLQHNKDFDIDLFMAINDENSDCEYYNIMKEKLKQWLKCCVIKKFTIPEETANLFNPNECITNHEQVNLQKINGKFLPYNCLSMYYNDNLSFKLACEYAENNNFEYDYYLKYRSDMINLILPTTINKDDVHLHCAIPFCFFTSLGLFKKPIISDAFSWGNRKTMSIYCNTYDYVIQKNKLYDGKYFLHFESSLTDNIYENNVPISYYNIKYSLDKNRRMFDDIYIDSRPPIRNQTYLIKITDSKSTNYIEPDKHE